MRVKNAADTQSPPLVYNTNNSNKSPDVTPFEDAGTSNVYGSYNRKAALALEHNILNTVAVCGEERFGVLTLTFKRPVRDAKVAQERWNSLNTGLLKKLFHGSIMVKERQRNGAWHFHVLVVCKDDVLTGFDTESYEEAVRLDDRLLLHNFRRRKSARNIFSRDEWVLPGSQEERARALMEYMHKTAPPLLLELLDELKVRLPGYGFGRFEFSPMRSNAEAVARYFSKGYRHSVTRRSDRDKGVRLVSYSGLLKFANSRFSWVEGGRSWRLGVGIVAGYLTERGMRTEDGDDLAYWLGPRWAWNLRDLIPRISEYGVVPSGIIASVLQRYVRKEAGGERN